MDSYKNKYLKYKNKYLELQRGGGKQEVVMKYIVLQTHKKLWINKLWIKWINNNNMKNLFQVMTCLKSITLLKVFGI